MHLSLLAFNSSIKHDHGPTIQLHCLFALASWHYKEGVGMQSIPTHYKEQQIWTTLKPHTPS